MSSRWLVAAATLFGLLVPVWCILRHAGTPRDPVYTVAEVRAALRRDPDAWINRALLVRGVAETVPCTPAPAGPPACPSRQFWLTAGGASTGGAVPLSLGTGSRLLTALRRIRLVGALAPAPQVPRWGAMATYRVQLRAAPAGPCPGPPCYAILLLDAAL